MTEYTRAPAPDAYPFVGPILASSTDETPAETADLPAAPAPVLAGTATPVPPVPNRVSKADSRIAGIDVARALAMIGMVAVHIGPYYPAPTTAGRIYALTHGRASVLFMLLAGVGVSLLAAARGGNWLRTAGRLAWRTALLLPLGLYLQSLDGHWVLVILPQYAALFLFAIVFVRLRDRWLLLLAGTSALVGTTAFLAGSIYAPRVFDRAMVTWDQPWRDLLHGLLLSGPYPLIVWATPFLFGIWLGRRNLRSNWLPWTLLLGGALVAAGAVFLSNWLTSLWADIPFWQRSLIQFGNPEFQVTLNAAPEWRRIAIDDAHSQMPLWIIGATGSALAVLGACLLLARALRKLLWPFVAMGQLALTLYVSHLIALHFFRPALSSDQVGEASLLVLGFAVLSMLFATAWRAWRPYGPLEALMRPPWEVVAEWRRKRAARKADAQQIVNRF